MDRNLEGGDVSGGAVDGLQLFLRPGWRFYATSDPSLYLCSLLCRRAAVSTACAVTMRREWRCGICEDSATDKERDRIDLVRAG